MSAPTLADLIREFYLERVVLLMRHEDVAACVTDYDINNAYQYIINREETHLTWVRSAIEDLGGTTPAAGEEPAVEAPARDAAAAFIADDARATAGFIDQWQPRVETVTNARDRGMLRVILGEMREQQRFFEQAAAGRDDLLGRRLDAGARRGQVIASRWVGD